MFFEATTRISAAVGLAGTRSRDTGIFLISRSSGRFVVDAADELSSGLSRGTGGPCVLTLLKSLDRSLQFNRSVY